MHWVPGRQLPQQLYVLIQAHAGPHNRHGRMTHTNRTHVLPFQSAGYATVVPDPGGTSEDAGRNTVPPLKNPFPYPTHNRPTPHQIFHLPFGATPAQIKARYYELVRTHHPDSSYTAHLPSPLAHARFRSVKAAYDFLQGKTLSPHPNARPAPSPKNFDPYMQELARRRRAHYASQGVGEDNTVGEGWAKPGWGEGFGAPKGQRSEWNEDGTRERIILAFGVMALVAGLFPTLPSMLISAFTTPTYPPAAPPPATVHRKGLATYVAKPDPGPSFPSNLPFVPDLDKGHREAVSALAQCRFERKEMGAERRDSVRQRAKEIKGEGEETGE